MCARERVFVCVFALTCSVYTHVCTCVRMCLRMNMYARADMCRICVYDMCIICHTDLSACLLVFSFLCLLIRKTNYEILFY